MNKVFLLLLLTFLVLFVNNQVNAQNTGYLKFEFNVDSVLLVIDYKYDERIMLSSGDSVKIIAGSHVLNLSTLFGSDITRNLFVFQDTTRLFSYNFRPPVQNVISLRNNYSARNHFNANVFIVTDEESDVYVNDHYLGSGFTYFDSNQKKNNIRIEHPVLGNKTYLLSAESLPKVYELYQRPDKFTHTALSVLPGASQIYKKQFLKGGLLLAGSIATGYLSFSSHAKYEDELALFRRMEEDYYNARDEQTALILGNEVEYQYKVMKDANDQYKLILGTAITIYALNMLDAFISKPKSGYRDKKPLEFYLSKESGFVGDASTATLKVNF